MAIKLAVGETSFTHLKPRITVIGVGGGGGNAISNMMSKNLEGVDFVVANTDAQALALSPATRKIQLGLEITQGLGAGARPEIGKMAAEEAKEEIEKELADSNMVFITAGMGGGTGSGAAPVVAKIAKEKGILTVGVVTKPFAFEGKKRMENAESALETFISEVDSIIVIPNQNLFRIADKNTTLKDAFVKADEVLYDGVRSITDLMIMPGLINLDFADVKRIMEDKGKAIMGTGEAEGDDRARVAAEQALSNPILDDCSMKGAKGVLINITGGSDITLMEIDEAVNIIREEVDENAEIIFGSSYDDSLAGRIRVSIVVTGIDEEATAQYLKTREMNAYVNLNTVKPAPVEEPEPIKKLEPVVEEIADEVEEEPVAVKEEVFEKKAPVIEETKPALVEEKVVEINAVKKPAAPVQEDLLSVRAADTEETHQSSALFSAIINKPVVANTEDVMPIRNELADIRPEKPFAPTARVRIIEEEPQLFPDHGEVEFERERKAREETQAMVADDDGEPRQQRFIDKILGISRARETKKQQQPQVQMPQPQAKPSGVPQFEELESFTEEDLDIPSFLRRK